VQVSIVARCSWIPLTVCSSLAPLLAASLASAGDTIKLSGPMALAEAGDVVSYLVT
jgi:hypothetical protein